MKVGYPFDSPISVHEHPWKKKFEIAFVLGKNIKVAIMDWERWGGYPLTHHMD